LPFLGGRLSQKTTLGFVTTTLRKDQYHLPKVVVPMIKEEVSRMGQSNALILNALL